MVLQYYYHHFFLCLYTLVCVCVRDRFIHAEIEVPSNGESWRIVLGIQYLRFFFACCIDRRWRFRY